MKTIEICGCLLLGGLALGALAQDEKPKRQNPPIAPAERLETLEIRASKERYLGGEPVVVTVRLVNRSTKTASFLMLGPKLEWKVKRENKKVLLSYLGKDQSKGEKISYRDVAVGQSNEYPVLLSRLFDFSRAGEYTLSCEKRLKNENKEPGTELVGPLVVSRTIKITVDEDDVEAKS